MDKVITCGLNEDFIGNLADFVEDNFLKKGSDISRLAFVFGGKRPALFLKKALAGRTNKSFFSPAFFSIDEFVQYTLSKKAPFMKMPDVESWYALYTLAGDVAPEIIKGREEFSQFLPWAREISGFIDLLDFENVPSESLESVEASAAIGYDIPESINTSLRNIIALREAYHKLLSARNSLSRGFVYLSAAEAVREVSFDEFDRILFCGFFYMRKTELRIIKHLYDSDKAILFFQGNEDRWPVLKDVSRTFSCSINPRREQKNNYSLSLYSAFDIHSQVCTVREILKKTGEFDSTVVILPEPESMIPLISEIGSSAGEFNVSLGYPLKRSSLYSLFEFIVRAQKTRKGAAYYTRDYIGALSQPLAKNLRTDSGYGATRVLVHKIEEFLLGMEPAPISGKLFVQLEEVESESHLFELAAETLKHMDTEVSAEDLRDVLGELHLLLFGLWEDISNFHSFAESLGKFLDTLIRKSFIANYPLNLKIAERVYSIKDDLLNAPFSKEVFPKEDIFKIFRNMLENEMVAFSGSPLKGLQVLGTLETRCLDFENVIIMDANESRLPSLRVREPLIPHEVIMGLGLDVIGKEEEIQRYLFRRIISGAKNVHLIYEENQEKERSRFVEELVWQAEKKANKLDVVPVPRVSFSVNVLPAKTEVGKTAAMLKFLKDFRFSASSVNTYVQCPLRFYYRYMLGLEEKQELLEDPEGREIGTFIHELLENAFSVFVGKKPRLDRDFREGFFRTFEEMFERTFSKRMRPGSFLLENVMRFRLERFLEFEKTSDERNIKEILYLERAFEEKLELSGAAFRFKYIVDRVDRLRDGSLLILDYKTGTDMPKPQGTDSLEKMELERGSIRDRIRSFQLPLYYYFESRRHRGETLNAALYNLRNPGLTYFRDKRTDVEKTMEICMNALDFILREILNPDALFAADREKERTCRNCPFSYLCR